MKRKTRISNQQEDNPGVNIMPPAIFFTCLAAGGVSEIFLPTPFALLSHPLFMWSGIIIGFCGFWFMTIADQKFKIEETNVETNQPATQVVKNGAFRFSRNPMYVGGSAFFIGLALALGSFWLLLAYLPLGAYLVFYVVPREEAYMIRTFGDEYLSYFNSVRRWI